MRWHPRDAFQNHADDLGLRTLTRFRFLRGRVVVAMGLLIGLVVLPEYSKGYINLNDVALDRDCSRSHFNSVSDDTNCFNNQFITELRLVQWGAIEDIPVFSPSPNEDPSLTISGSLKEWNWYIRGVTQNGGVGANDQRSGPRMAHDLISVSIQIGEPIIVVELPSWEGFPTDVVDHVSGNGSATIPPSRHSPQIVSYLLGLEALNKHKGSLYDDEGLACNVGLLAYCSPLKGGKDRIGDGHTDVNRSYENENPFRFLIPAWIGLALLLTGGFLTGYVLDGYLWTGRLIHGWALGFAVGSYACGLSLLALGLARFVGWLR